MEPALEEGDDQQSPVAGGSNVPAEMEPAFGERDDGCTGQHRSHAQAAAMEPALGERDDEHAWLQEPNMQLAAMEPALGERDDGSGAKAQARRWAPQWSPLLVSGMTASGDRGARRAPEAAME